MPAKILDGKALAEKIRKQIRDKIQARLKQDLSPPGLAVIIVGDNPASLSYVHHKQEDCKEVGIQSFRHHLPANTDQQTVLRLIQELNVDPKVHGILLQLPLPEALQADKLLRSIAPHKDVDGFHPHNMGLLVLRTPQLRPCTPYGVMKLLETADIDIAGKHAVVVGASNIVGRPMALELLLAKCTVTVCHRFTHHLASHLQTADILISAMGKPGVIQSDWIKPEAIVVDVGFTRLSDGEIVGDIDFKTASQRASWITPVPGGVGPMTRAMLLENTLLAMEQIYKAKD